MSSQSLVGRLASSAMTRTRTETEADENEADERQRRRQQQQQHHSLKPQVSKQNAEQASELRDFVQCEPHLIDAHQDSQIAKFYANRSVFITGASGFVGKCLLEKLLRSCPDIGQVYILMRPKRGLEVGERVEALVRSELFARLRELPHGQRQLRKIRAVRGDITRPLLGVNVQELALLRERVSIVFHSAATVRFVEPLKLAIENNVSSVHNLIKLASELEALEALVHVSTAYANCDRSHVDEVFYEAPLPADKLLDMSQWMDARTLDEIAPALLGKRPNTYTYTKAVAESLLVERSRKQLAHVPIAMVRPSIVGGTWRQPLRGWVDNFNGPTGVVLSMMCGALQAMIAQPYYCADIVPVDVVANLIICAAWQVHAGAKSKHQQQPDKQRQQQQQQQQQQQSLTNTTKLTNTDTTNITVFNCISGALNPVQWGRFANTIIRTSEQYPCSNVVRAPGSRLIANEHLFYVYNLLSHASFAYIADALMRLVGRKQKFVILYNRMMKMIETLKPFTLNQWTFDCTNVSLLYDKLEPIDRDIFNFDIRQMDWTDYLRRYYVGSKLYALKDDPEQLSSARARVTVLKFAGRTVQWMLIALVYYFLLSGSSIETRTVKCLQQALAVFIDLALGASAQVDAAT